MLATLLAPTAGRVSVCGFDVVQQPREVRKRIGYVQQHIATNRYYLTGRECVELEASLYHVPRGEVGKRAEEVLAVVGLSAAADKRFPTYSGGMQKRLDLACGLLHQPDLLILDEPTLGLDVQSRHHIWEYVHGLQAQGVTVLLATNYLDEADRLCNRLTIIDHGKAVVTGAPRDLKREVGADVIGVVASDCGALERRLAEADWVTRITPGEDGSLHVYAADATAAMPAIMRMAVEDGIQLERVTYSQPSLDDVFLLHTGRELREGDAA
jgi:ABC-2 type transport system ATP-binding protein